MNEFLSLLRADGSIIINRNLAKNIGLDEAIIYSEILSGYKYFEDRERLTEDGFYFNTVENLEQQTTFKDYKQRALIKKLIDLKLIEMKIMGIPQKRYFKPNPDENILRKYLKTHKDTIIKDETILKEMKKQEDLERTVREYNRESHNNCSKIEEDIPLKIKGTIPCKSKHYNNTNNNTNKYYTSYNTILTPKEGVSNRNEITTPVNEFVEYWNSKKNLRKHKLNTKTYGKSSELFNQILLGIFGQKNVICEKYKKTNNITTETLFKNADKKDIFEAIDRFNLLCDPAAPNFKTGYPKSCDLFLFNPVGQSSFFYALFGPGKEPVPGKVLPIDSEILAIYEKQLANKKINEIEKNELVKGVNFVVRMFRDYTNKVGKENVPYSLKNGSFYKKHIRFLQDRYLDAGVFTFSHILNKNIWAKFIIWLKQVHQIDLYKGIGT